MSLEAPQNVQLCDDELSWDPEPNVTGYNIHRDGKYFATVFKNFFTVPFDADWSVSAFRKRESHSPRSAPMLLCPPRIPQHDASTPDFVRQMNLIFEDLFESGVDPALWRTELLWGDETIINQEEQVYVDTQNGNLPPFDNVPSPFSTTADGDLSITATPLSAALQASTDRRFGSGKLCAPDHPFRGGYLEFCFRAPCMGDGTWIGMWILNRFYYDNAFQKNLAENGGGSNGNDKFNFETDFELVFGPNNAGAAAVKMAHHYFTGDRNDPNNYHLWSLDSSGFRQVDQNTGALASQFNVYTDCNGSQALTLPDAEGNFCDGFHTVGLHWEPGQFMDFYVDGALSNCIRDPPLVPDQAMYPIINYAVGGTFPYGTPPSQFAPQGQFPQSLDIRHVKIWN